MGEFRPDRTYQIPTPCQSMLGIGCLTIRIFRSSDGPKTTPPRALAQRRNAGPGNDFEKQTWWSNIKPVWYSLHSIDHSLLMLLYVVHYKSVSLFFVVFSWLQQQNLVPHFLSTAFRVLYSKESFPPHLCLRLAMKEVAGERLAAPWANRKMTTLQVAM